jgi:hypothetical protein
LINSIFFSNSKNKLRNSLSVFIIIKDKISIKFTKYSQFSDKSQFTLYNALHNGNVNVKNVSITYIAMIN